MNFFSRMYGIDLFSLFLFFLSALFSFSKYTSLVGFVLLVYSLLRIMSKNTYKRQLELNKFIGILNKPLSKIGRSIPNNLPPINFYGLSFYFKILKNKFYQWKSYKIKKCPNCSQKLRLPRKKGLIVVTCKRCSHKFDLRT